MVSGINIIRIRNLEISAAAHFAHEFLNFENFDFSENPELGTGGGQRKNKKNKKS